MHTLIFEFVPMLYMYDAIIFEQQILMSLNTLLFFVIKGYRSYLLLRQQVMEWQNINSRIAQE